MAVGVAGVRVGCWTSPTGASGCTVVLPPAGTVGALTVRGAAPGTREAAALGPAGKVVVCHGVVLAGGSAYGLAAADGVATWLEEHGVGYPVSTGLVPIVGAAIVLDEAVATPAARPGPAAGRAACDAAEDGEVPEGSVGGGTGCTVAKVAGLAHAWRGGQGVAVRHGGGVTVGAVVVNNAVGEIVEDDGSFLARSRAPVGTPRYPTDRGALAAPRSTAPPEGPVPGTVIGCVVTDAALTKPQAARVADLAHGGVVRTVRPAHTSMDGDALFCLATGTQDEKQDHGHEDARTDLVAALAVEAVADACRRGVRAATTRGGIPGMGDEEAVG